MMATNMGGNPALFVARLQEWHAAEILALKAERDEAQGLLKRALDSIANHAEEDSALRQRLAEAEKSRDGWRDSARAEVVRAEKAEAALEKMRGMSEG